MLAVRRTAHPFSVDTLEAPPFFFLFYYITYHFEENPLLPDGPITNAHCIISGGNKTWLRSPSVAAGTLINHLSARLRPTNTSASRHLLAANRSVTWSHVVLPSFSNFYFLKCHEPGEKLHNFSFIFLIRRGYSDMLKKKKVCSFLIHFIQHETNTCSSCN